LKQYNKLLIDISEASTELQKKILALDFSNLDISDYSKRYWSDNIRKLNYIMQCNTFILCKAVEQSQKNISEIILVDNGGGTGSLTLLAKAAGIRTVIYNDIYDVSCIDASNVGRALGIVADDYVCADSDELVNYFRSKNQDCDIVVSRNVIEHIYDLNKYFYNISSVSKSNLVLCFATTANIKNPLVNLYTRNIQRKAERDGIKGKWEKGRDSIKSFLQIRKEIISDNFKSLSSSKIELYAKATRGLMRADIISIVADYEIGKSKPILPIDPTNTCDPTTGNRTENLLSAKEYELLMARNALTFKLIPGFYNTQYSLSLLNVVTPIVNFLINKIPFMAIYLAPFICVVGVKSKNN